MASPDAVSYSFRKRSCKDCSASRSLLRRRRCCGRSAHSSDKVSNKHSRSQRYNPIGRFPWYRWMRPSKPNDSGIDSNFNACSSTPLIRIQCLRSYLPGFTLPSVYSSSSGPNAPLLPSLHRCRSENSVNQYVTSLLDLLEKVSRFHPHQAGRLFFLDLQCWLGHRFHSFHDMCPALHRLSGRSPNGGQHTKPHGRASVTPITHRRIASLERVQF